MVPSEPHEQNIDKNNRANYDAVVAKWFFQTSELREDITYMTLRKTIPTLGLLQKKVHRVLAIGLLAAASAVGCSASRPVQRSGDNASSSPSVAKSVAEAPKQSTEGAERASAQQGEQASTGEKTAVSGGPALQAQPSVAPVAASPAPAEVGDKIPEGAITGKVVSSFRGDDGKMTLYLNQGSAAKLRVGLNGHILEGSEGGRKLDGGSFVITKVLGDNQSVATSNYYKSLGKNDRFMIIKPK